MRGLLQCLPSSQGAKTFLAAGSVKQGNWGNTGFAELDQIGCPPEPSACQQQYLIWAAPVKVPTVQI